MHPFGSFLATRNRLGPSASDRQAEIRAMYRRPDALPLPPEPEPEPERPGHLERLVAAVPVLRRLTTHRV